MTELMMRQSLIKCTYLTKTGSKTSKFNKNRFQNVQNVCKARSNEAGSTRTKATLSLSYDLKTGFKMSKMSVKRD